MNEDANTCVPLQNEDESDELIEKIPKKSEGIYNRSYDKFIAWKLENKYSSVSEKVLLDYFKKLVAKQKPSSVMTEYSILKRMLSERVHIDISKYWKLQTYMKNISVGYQGKKAKTFSQAEIEKFIAEAPDRDYLLHKVVVIFGVVGACRRIELHKLMYKDVHDSQYENKTLTVHIRSDGNKIERIFTITGKYYDICRKYMDGRPDCNNPKFFLRYAKKKCVTQNCGINMFGGMGKAVADFLNLPNSELYTGHCFRRTGKLLQRGEHFGSSEAKVHIVPLSQLQERRVPVARASCSGTSLCSDEDSSDTNTSNPPEPANPRSLEQCRVCGDITNNCVKVTSEKPYLVNNRTALALNNVSVDLDFNDTLPKAVCRYCDEKLQDIYNFVNQVKTAQDTLTNVAKGKEFETLVIKSETFSPSPEDNDTEEGNVSVTETVDSFSQFVKNTVFAYKRKNDSQISVMDAKKHKPEATKKVIAGIEKKPKEFESTELIIDIKEEVVDKDMYSEKERDMDSETGIKSEDSYNGSEKHSELEVGAVVIEGFPGDNSWYT